MPQREPAYIALPLLVYTMYTSNDDWEYFTDDNTGQSPIEENWQYMSWGLAGKTNVNTYTHEHETPKA